MILIWTNFIGFDFRINGGGPFFFVTVTERGEERCERYAETWSEAEAVHRDMVDTVKARYRGASG